MTISFSKGGLVDVLILYLYLVISRPEVYLQKYLCLLQLIEEVINHQQRILVFYSYFVQLLKSIHNLNVPSFFFMNRTGAPQGDMLKSIHNPNVPSSRDPQDVIAVLSALMYSFCKGFSTLELLQESSLQRSQYLSLRVVWIPPEIYPQTPLVPHGIQSLTPYPQVLPPSRMQIIDSLSYSTSLAALLRFI
jgi:hypothetical protein